MKIKYNLLKKYKIFNILVYFYIQNNKNNLDVKKTNLYIEFKLKNKKMNLILYKNLDIEIGLRKKIIKINFNELNTYPQFNKNMKFNLIKNIPLKDSVARLLFLIINHIEDNFLIDEEQNEIDSHRLTMTEAQCQKHLITSHGFNIEKIKNYSKSKLLDEMAEINRFKILQMGDIRRKDIHYFDVGYSTLNIEYKDSYQYEDQFLSFEKVFIGNDFFKILIENNNKVIINAGVTFLVDLLGYEDIKKNTFMQYSILITDIALFMYYKFTNNRKYLNCKKNMVSNLLEEEKNGNEYTIHKTLYFINIIDNIYTENKFVEKINTVLINFFSKKMKDYDCCRNIENFSYSKDFIKSTTILTDVLDSFLLSFYLKEISSPITVSINKDTLKNFESIDINENLDLNKQLFLRFDSKYMNGIYAIIFNPINDTAIIFFESNKKHKFTLILNNMIGIYNETYNYTGIPNINENYFNDIKDKYMMKEVLDVFILKFENYYDKIQNLIISIHLNSYFENNDYNNIVCKNKEENLYLTYEKNNKYKINFFK